MASNDLSFLSSLIGLVNPAGDNSVNRKEEENKTANKTENSKAQTDSLVNTNTQGQTASSGTNVQTLDTQSKTVTQDYVSPEAVTAIVNSMLAGTSGLAATAAGEKRAGLYNSTTNQMLVNDLLARTAAEAAKLNKTSTSTTNNTGTNTTTNNSVSNTVSNATSNTRSGTTTNANSSATDSGTLTANIDTVNKGQISKNTAGTVAGAIAANSLVSNLTGKSIPDNISGLAKRLVNGTSEFVPPASSGGGYTSGTDILNELGINSGSGEALNAFDVPMGDLSSIGQVAGDVGLNLAQFATPAAIMSAVYNIDPITTMVGDTVAKVADPVFNGVQSVMNSTVDKVEDKLGDIIEGVWILCTELNRQNKLPTRFYVHGAKVFKNYPDKVKQGYYFWAIPAVFYIRLKPKSLLCKFFEKIFLWRAEDIAHKAGVRSAKRNIKGKLVTTVLYPLCYVIGCFVKEQNWEVVYGKYSATK